MSWQPLGLAWQLLPPTLTRVLLQALYSTKPSLQPRVNADASAQERVVQEARARKHATRAQATVVASYLVYSLGQSVWRAETTPNFYSLLQIDRSRVPTGEDEFDGMLKSQWRKLVRRAHPDVAGEQNEGVFVAMRFAYETLLDRTKREAYDRFGPEVLRCGAQCANSFEYLRFGLNSTVFFYLAVIGSLLLLGWVGRSDPSAYWRYVCLGLILSMEVRVVLAPAFSSPFDVLPWFASLAPYQHVLLLHDLFITLSCACGQILPLLSPQPVKATPEQQVEPLLNALAQSAAETDNEILRLVRSDVQSSLGPVPAAVRESRIDSTLDRIKDGALQTMIDSRVKVESEGGAAWAEAVKMSRVKVEAVEPQVKLEPDAEPVSVDPVVKRENPAVDSV